MYIHTSLETLRTAKDFSQYGHVSLVRAMQVAAGSAVAGHAFFIVGRDTPVRQQLADWFTQLLLCEKPTGDPCGKCANCAHPQRLLGSRLLTVAPGERGTYVVETIRALRGQLAVATEGASTRVVRLDGAEGLLPASANALLKLLEEPNPHCKYVLTATEDQRVLPTVRSRMATFRVQLIPRYTCKSVLRQAGIRNEALQELALALAPGQPGQALHIAEAADTLPELVRSVRGLGPVSLAARFRFLQDHLERAEDQRAAASTFLTAWSVAFPHQDVPQLLVSASALQTNATPRTILESFLTQSV